MATETRDISVETPDGAMPVALAAPAGAGRHPAVIVLMEAFGLVPHLREVARRLADEGYVAAVPDIYYRLGADRTARYDELPKAIGLMQKVDDDKFVADLRALCDALAARADVDGARIGLTGFCMGGRLTMLAACALPDRVKAAAPFYGGGIHALAPRFESIRCPLYLFWGERDAFIPLDQVRGVEVRLKDLGKRFRSKVYTGAVHGFFCPDRAESYHAASAADAWNELKGFFAANLR
jgi:carboxymethylenebutenolidase